jgi:predicted O-linked N-acetylglucosamine transferase (SPINDLY family)
VSTADEHFQRALAAYQAGDNLTAEIGYRQFLEVNPDDAACLNNLGSLVARRGETDEAEHFYRRAIAAAPDQINPRFNLGNLYRRLKRLREAAAEYEEVLRLAPNTVPALVNLGLTVNESGNWARAVECFARAATIAPDVPDVLVYLGDALARCGRREEAILALREAVGRFPDAPRGHLHLGIQLAAGGATEEAITAIERALALDPEYPEAHNARGVALEVAGRTDDAQRAYRAALRARPDYAEALSNLGTSLSQQGESIGAADALRRALALAPNPVTQSTLLANLVFSAALTAEQVRDEHVAWANAHAAPLAGGPAAPARAPGGSGRVRIGYVFGEFRSRAACAFLEALLAHHDRTRFHVTAYANTTRQDEAFVRMRRLADVWKQVARVSDEQLARLVRADEIDVLVDLNGHTAGNRLLAFARKPAAAQIALFGYPATTGLGAMDYRITDPVTDPPGRSEALYVEKLLRLPDLSWVYVPPPAAPPPAAPAPAGRERSFAFGCLNHPGKLSEPCVGAWAAILKAVPKSRLVLLAGQSVASAEALAARFTTRGVSSDRLELVYRMDAADYLEAHRPLDLALDPFPYNGGVTTCDALWMGVPVLTPAGSDARGRQGTAILTALGLPEFIADGPDQLVSLAATWADQRQSLADIRGTLRDIMTQSPVTAAADYVKHLEGAYGATQTR